jgi:hypothetical protein
VAKLDMTKFQRANFKWQISKGLLPFALCLLPVRLSAAVADGYVVRVENKTIYLDWGKSSGVKPGDGFRLYRKGAALKHPVTGALLGHAEEAAGTGEIEKVEEKFSIGSLILPVGTPRVGDRTGWLPPDDAQSAPEAASVSPEADLLPEVPALSELWRSEPLEKNVAGITFSDLDGDGRQDVIVAYRKKIKAYRLKDKKLEPLASFDKKNYGEWLAIDAADVKKEGRDELFATAYQTGIDRARIVVLRYEDGHLNAVANLDGFAQAVQGPGGRKAVYWQGFSGFKDVRFTAASELQWNAEKKTYSPGPALDLKLLREQLLGFAWGNWYGSPDENFAILERGERLYVTSKDVKWRSSEVYGGTKNDFTVSNDKIGNVSPRLLSWRPAGSDKNQLIVTENIPDFGLRMQYIKIFKKAEITGLIWSGTEMKPVWRLNVPAYLADYGIADVLGQSKPQLWVAVVGPGDKTVLLSYSLP